MFDDLKEKTNEVMIGLLTENQTHCFIFISLTIPGNDQCDDEAARENLAQGEETQGQTLAQEGRVTLLIFFHGEGFVKYCLALAVYLYHLYACMYIGLAKESSSFYTHECLLIT